MFSTGNGNTERTDKIASYIQHRCVDCVGSIGSDEKTMSQRDVYTWYSDRIIIPACTGTSLRKICMKIKTHNHDFYTCTRCQVCGHSYINYTSGADLNTHIGKYPHSGNCIVTNNGSDIKPSATVDLGADDRT